MICLWFNFALLICLLRATLKVFKLFGTYEDGSVFLFAISRKCCLERQHKHTQTTILKKYLTSKILSFFLIPKFYKFYICKNSISFLKKVISIFQNFIHCIGTVSSTMLYLKINTYCKWHITKRQGCIIGKSTRYLNKTALAQIPGLPFNSCITLRKLQNLLVPLFPHL